MSASPLLFTLPPGHSPLHFHLRALSLPRGQLIAASHTVHQPPCLPGLSGFRAWSGFSPSETLEVQSSQECTGVTGAPGWGPGAGQVRAGPQHRCYFPGAGPGAVTDRSVPKGAKGSRVVWNHLPGAHLASFPLLTWLESVFPSLPALDTTYWEATRQGEDRVSGTQCPSTRGSVLPVQALYRE